MTVEELACFASYLAREWALPEARRDDLLMWGATLAMRGYSAETILTHMEIRAEVIAAEGESEEFVKGFKGMAEGAA